MLWVSAISQVVPLFVPMCLMKLVIEVIGWSVSRLAAPGVATVTLALVVETATSSNQPV